MVRKFDDAAREAKYDVHRANRLVCNLGASNLGIRRATRDEALDIINRVFAHIDNAYDILLGLYDDLEGDRSQWEGDRSQWEGMYARAIAIDNRCKVLYNIRILAKPTHPIVQTLQTLGG
jgi:hypothetical protein